MGNVRRHFHDLCPVYNGIFGKSGHAEGTIQFLALPVGKLRILFQRVVANAQIGFPFQAVTAMMTGPEQGYHYPIAHLVTGHVGAQGGNCARGFMPCDERGFIVPFPVHDVDIAVTDGTCLHGNLDFIGSRWFQIYVLDDQGSTIFITNSGFDGLHARKFLHCDLQYSIRKAKGNPVPLSAFGERDGLAPRHPLSLVCPWPNCRLASGGRVRCRPTPTPCPNGLGPMPGPAGRRLRPIDSRVKHEYSKVYESVQSAPKCRLDRHACLRIRCCLLSPASSHAYTCTGRCEPVAVLPGTTAICPGWTRLRCVCGTGGRHQVRHGPKVWHH